MSAMPSPAPAAGKHAKIFDLLHQASRREAQETSADAGEELDPKHADAFLRTALGSFALKPVAEAKPRERETGLAAKMQRVLPQQPMPIVARVSG